MKNALTPSLSNNQGPNFQSKFSFKFSIREYMSMPTFIVHDLSPEQNIILYIKANLSYNLKAYNIISYNFSLKDQN